MPLQELFQLHVSPWELIARGSAMYWFLYLILRVVLRRDAGAVGLADILLLVLVADAAQNGMAGEYKTITEGMILVTTIVGWNWLLDWACYHFPLVERFANPTPLVLIRAGRVIRANLAREWISMDELMGKLREHGIERPGEVKMARMESNGEISVIRYPDGLQKNPHGGRRRTAAG